MPVEEESGFSISLPDGSWFRFANTGAYKRLAGRAMKEMDFGYRDESDGRIVLIELTSYDKSTAPPRSDVLLREMIDKARDSLLMLQAVWRGHGTAKPSRSSCPTHVARNRGFGSASSSS